MQYPDYKIGLRAFMKLKPAQVCFMKPKDRLACCCQYHENTKHAVRAFNRLSTEIHQGNPCGPDAPCNQRGKIPESAHSLFQWLLCSLARTADTALGHTAVQPEWPPRAECVSGTCTKCAGGLLKLRFCSKELELGGERRYVYNLYETQEQCDNQVRTLHMRATPAPLHRNACTGTATPHRPSIMALAKFFTTHNGSLSHTLLPRRTRARFAEGDNAGLVLHTQAKNKVVKRTVLAKHYGPPGIVVANLYRWLRGHSTNIEKMSTAAKGLQCTCVGHLLEEGGRSWTERTDFIGRCVSPKLRLFVEHAFNARYFGEMFKDARTWFPLGEALMVMDFAMNFRCARIPCLLLAASWFCRSWCRFHRGSCNGDMGETSQGCIKVRSV